MASENGNKTWDTFLNQHRSLVSLLDDHASLLVEIRKLCQGNGAAQELVHTRLNTTEILIATFKQSAESLQEITKREEETIDEDVKVSGPEVTSVPIRPTKKPNSQTSPKPAPDPSGLFTIDLNPTPIEQLFNKKLAHPSVGAKAKANPKRRAEDRPDQAAPVPQNDPKQKKTKTNHERKAPPPPSVEDAEEEDDAAEEEEDDSFAKSVAARTNAKEEKRKAKADKKRKREGDEPDEAMKSPKGKKRKAKHESKVESPTKAVPPTASASTAAKKPKAKGNDKRQFAQTGLEIEDENDGNHPNGASSGGKRKRPKRKQAKP